MRACRAAVVAVGVAAAAGARLGWAEPQPQQTAPPRARVRVRRADTHLTALDNVIVGYEERLRETASLEKVFKYFSSLVVGGREMCTPLDMVRAITPGVAPSSFTKPINIPLFESDPEEVRAQLSPQEAPEFFKFGSESDLGILSYGRFLICITLLSIPKEQLSVVYHMSCGRDFRNQALRGNGLTAANLDFILSKHIFTRDQGYLGGNHSQTSIFRHLFGPDLAKELTLEELQELHSNLCAEVLKMEYYLLSDRWEQGGMSLVGFAKAVAALTPNDYRAQYAKRAHRLYNTPVPPEFLVRREPLGNEAYDPPLEELEGNVAQDCFISLEEWGAWKEVLKQLEGCEQAVRLYADEEGRFTPSNLRRAARAVAGVELSKAQIWVLFQLFDVRNESMLRHDDFVRLMRRHSSLQAKLKGPDGLGLGLLFRCCVQCAHDWYDGTIETEEQQQQQQQPQPSAHSLAPLPVENSSELSLPPNESPNRTTTGATTTTTTTTTSTQHGGVSNGGFED